MTNNSRHHHQPMRRTTICKVYCLGWSTATDIPSPNCMTISPPPRSWACGSSRRHNRATWYMVVAASSADVGGFALSPLKKCGMNMASFDNGLGIGIPAPFHGRRCKLCASTKTRLPRLPQYDMSRETARKISGARWQHDTHLRWGRCVRVCHTN